VELDGIGNVPKEDIDVKFSKDSFEMLCNINQKQYRFSLSNLAQNIDPKLAYDTAETHIFQ
jgi:hypothetical protein